MSIWPITPPRDEPRHAGNGSLIAEYAQERRIFVPIDTAPKHLIDAFLAAEDKNFYDHVGIDFIGIVRAVFANVVNVVSGDGWKARQPSPSKWRKTFC